MSARVLSSRRRGPRPGFAVVLGMACGLLVTALLVPETSSGLRAARSDPERRTRSTAGAGAAAPAVGTPPEERAEPSSGQDGGRAGSAPTSVPEDGGRGDGDSGGGDPGGGDPDGGDPDGGTPSAGVRGVTADSVRIGVALPDLGPFGAASEEFDVGDVREQMEAILDGWYREGSVPVNGRDVEFVYREFSIFGTDEQIAACNGFVKDDEVFMVIGMRSFEAGAECLATRFQTPVVSLGTYVADQDYERRYPYHMTVRTSMALLARNLPRWAEERGILEGRTIGLYSMNDEVTNEMAADLERALGAVDQELAVHVKTDSTFAGQQDAIAVQQFRQSDVDLAILLVAALPASNFMENAESQLYRPTYLATDYGDHTSDAASSTFPAEQYDGTLAMTQTRTGEIRADGLTPRAEACLSNYERYSGRDIPRESPESAEMASILQACDAAAPVLHGLQEAGRSLTATSFIRGVETVRGLGMAAHGDISISAQEHHGAEQQRAIEWQGSCECWTALGGFSPFPAR